MFTQIASSALLMFVFIYACGMAPGMAISDNWFRLKYLNGWLDCPECFSEHLCYPEDEI